MLLLAQIIAASAGAWSVSGLSAGVVALAGPAALFYAAQRAGATALTVELDGAAVAGGALNFDAVAGHYATVVLASGQIAVCDDGASPRVLPDAGEVSMRAVNALSNATLLSVDCEQDDDVALLQSALAPGQCGPRVPTLQVRVRG